LAAESEKTVDGQVEAMMVQASHWLWHGRSQRL
jgi:hypothetical protein